MARRGRLGGPGEYTDVSVATEIKTPWLSYLSMMVLGPVFMSLLWSIGWLLWFYDAKQSGLRWYRWSLSWIEWWDKGGDLLYYISLLLAALFATGITMYRFYVETGAKRWDARDGAYYPGKVVPPEMRVGG